MASTFNELADAVASLDYAALFVFQCEDSLKQKRLSFATTDVFARSGSKRTRRLTCGWTVSRAAVKMAAQKNPSLITNRNKRCQSFTMVTKMQLSSDATTCFKSLIAAKISFANLA